LAAEISSDYEGLNPINTVLRGAVYFFVDLSRELSIPHSIDFLPISSYGPCPRTGVVRITKNMDIHGQHVLVVEDIIDTGLTLHYLTRTLPERGPASLKVCTFLDRAVQRIAKLQVDYRGFQTDEEYLVGYGLDYKGKWMNLPYIMAVTE
jgi:hypoxanthine phosphoribosyltransferase